MQNIKKEGKIMKKQLGKINKRIVTMLLVALMVTGMLPIQPITDVLDISITASAGTFSSGGSFSSV